MENRLASILAWGAALITVLVTDRISTDPANVGKMLVLSTLSWCCLFMIFAQLKAFLVTNKFLTLALAGFNLSLIVSMLTSANSFERGLYGIFGRNTGVVTYLALSFVFLAATCLRKRASLNKIMIALLVAGISNVILCLFEAAGKSPFRWNNPFNGVIGTLGNPNFLGSFMGIFFSALIALLISGNYSRNIKILQLLVLFLTAFVIFKSRALQGILVAGFGSAVVLFLYLRSKEKYRKILVTYSVILTTGFSVVIAGILQIGPLSSLLYKGSVSARGEYWQAGITMGMKHPFTGVGIDSYGTYYRAYRAQSATIFPGPETVTDSAHNVFIDIFAGAGFLGLFFYLAMILVVARAAVMTIQLSRKLDVTFIVIFIGWLSYLLQSTISINQIGLAIWGWLFGGCIVAYSRIHTPQETGAKSVQAKPSKEKSHNKGVRQESIPAGVLLASLAGAVLGAGLSLPPFFADVQMRGIQNGGGDKSQAIALAKHWPLDTVRMNRIVVLLANSGMSDQSAEVAAFATKAFPRDFPAWYSLYELSSEGSQQKLAFKAKLHELDPHNPKFLPN